MRYAFGYLVAVEFNHSLCGQLSFQLVACDDDATTVPTDCFCCVDWETSAVQIYTTAKQVLRDLLAVLQVSEGARPITKQQPVSGLNTG
jgi:hypothetical protein